MLAMVFAARGKWNILFLAQEAEPITRITFTRPAFLAIVRKLSAPLAQLDRGMVARVRPGREFEKLLSDVQIPRRAQRLVL